MKLWIDAQCFQSASRMRGIGRYVIELIAQIKRDYPEVEMLASLNAGLYEEALIARKILSPFISPENIYVWEGVPGAGEGLNGNDEARQLSQRLLAHHVATLNPDDGLAKSIDQADKMLYRAKDGGRNCVVALEYSEELHANNDQEIVIQAK